MCTSIHKPLREMGVIISHTYWSLFQYISSTI